MDEDLKIVLTSELEADEQASAQRIAAQLPNIARLINSKSSIKVGVSLDDANLKTQTQKISNQLENFSAKSKFSMKLDFGTDKVDDMVKKLRELNVPDSAIKNFVTGIDKGLVGISQIRTAFSEVGDSAKTVTATVEGITSAGERLRQTISQGFTWDDESKQWAEGVRRSTIDAIQNYEQLAQAEEKAAKAAQKDNESRVSYLTKQQSLLADIQATYTGATSVKPVIDDSHLAELNNAYNAINAQIQAMIAAEGRLDSVQQANLEAQIANLKRLVKEYQNAEYVATKLKAKTAVEVNNDEVNRLAEYEEKLRSSGILTDNFKQKITALREQLSTAFDRSSLTAYLDNFDRLEGDVDSFNAKIQSVNSLYSQLSSVSSKIARLQKQMASMDTSSEKYMESSKRLELLQNEELSLGRQISAYQEVVQYSSQAAQYELKRLDLQAQVATSEAAVADAASKISASISTVGTTVGLVETKFRALSNPTEELGQKVANLRVLMDAINNAASDSEKVNLFKQLNQEIAQCNKQITNLNGQARLDILDPVFAENLKKAKADLETIGRQWSKLKADPGLNAQFQQLGENLKFVERGELSLKEWTAQFSRFKSEVKAAGKNAQSFGDILKNNIAKVAQWGLSTVSIYGAISRLKSAANIVVELDTAMIDLKKTTNETDAAYRRFYQSANKTAKWLGVTTAEVIAQTAEWSRLGYSMAEAAKMAEDSAIFAAISPELNTEEATDGLISIMKAFGLEADEVLDGVISKINKLGKRIAQQCSNVLKESSYIG